MGEIIILALKWWKTIGWIFLNTILFGSSCFLLGVLVATQNYVIWLTILSLIGIIASVVSIFKKCTILLAEGMVAGLKFILNDEEIVNLLDKINEEDIFDILLDPDKTNRES